MSKPEQQNNNKLAKNEIICLSHSLSAKLNPTEVPTFSGEARERMITFLFLKEK